MFYGLKRGELPAKDAIHLNEIPLKNGSKSPRRNDLTLLDLRGDSDETFTFLYKRFYKPIAHYIRSRIHNPEVAEEITQEVFLKVHRFQDSFQEGHAFSTWLWTIAKNTVFDYLRGLKGNNKAAGPDFTQDTSVELEQLPCLRICAETRLIRRDQRRKLLKVFKVLTRLQKRVLWMRVIHQLSYQDISKQLQLSLASVKNLAYRAKITLVEAR